MRKRPLFTLAFLFALLIWFLVSMLGISFFSLPFSEGDNLTLSGQLLKTETKGERVYCYLQNVSCSDVSAFERDTDHVVRKALLIADVDDESISALLPGNKIQAEVTYENFRKARNQGNYDEEQYYHSLGIAAKFRLDGQIKIVSHRIFPLRCAMQWVKERLAAALDSVLDTQSSSKSETEKNDDTDSTANEAGWSHYPANENNNHADIFMAILTGDKTGLDAETKEMYRKSGIAHILAISGLHISFIGMSLFSLLRKRMRFSFAALISAAAMIGFCVMSGESASAVRATIMFLIRLLAMKFGKTFDLLSALGLSGILLLIQNPMYLFHSGFQLSFGAILGIGLLAPALRKFFKFNETNIRDFSGSVTNNFGIITNSFKAFFSKAKDAFLISFSVTLVTLPIIINTYYELPVYSVLLNLLVVPMMGLVLESGVFGVLLGLFSVFLGRMLIGAGVYMVTAIEFLCALSDRIPFSVIITGRISGVKVALYYVILILVIILAATAPRLVKRAITLLCLGAIMMCLIFIHPSVNQLQLTFFDVDQGDGILIESPSGTVYMIDGGSTSVSELYRYRIESALKYKGIPHIDYAIITHADTDHISAVLSMLEDDGAGSIPIRNLALPMIPDNANYDELVRRAKEAGVPVHTLYEGMRLNDPELSFSCLYPPKDFHGPDSNSYSAVLSMTYGSFKAVFTGDIDEDGETYLVTQGILEDCALLKVAHHGSKFSSGRRFLETVTPEISVISAGVHNSYGHPHEDVLKRLQSVGSEVYVTAESGEIRVMVDESGNAEVIPLLS